MATVSPPNHVSLDRLSRAFRAQDERCHGYVRRDVFEHIDDDDCPLKLVCDVLFPCGEGLIPYHTVLDFIFGPVAAPLPIGNSDSERWARWALFEAQMEIRRLKDELVDKDLELVRLRWELQRATKDREFLRAKVPAGTLSRESTPVVRLTHKAANGRHTYNSRSCRMPGVPGPAACFGHIRLELPEDPGHFDGIAYGAGLLVCAPRKLDELVVCDLNKNKPTVTVTHIDITHIAEGSFKYEGCAFDGEDLFVCAPRGADQLLLYWASTGKVRGVDISHITSEQHKYNGIAYGEGLFACVPYDVDHLLLYSRESGSAKAVDISHVATGTYKYNFIAYGEGLFVGAPRNADRILCHRPRTNQTWGVDISQLIVGPDKFAGVAYGAGVFVLAPYQANFVLTYRPGGDQLGVFDVTQIDTNLQKFAGAVYMGGSFVFSPFHADCILRFHPDTCELEGLPLPKSYLGRKEKWCRCAGSGEFMACVPYGCKEILLYSEAVRIRVASEEQGISVGYLLKEFHQQAIDVAGCQDPNFHQLKDLVYGPTAMGYGLICPRDGLPNCAMVDALPRARRQKATHFLSWVWGYNLSTVLGALENWMSSSSQCGEDDIFIWMCYACNNQFRIFDDDKPHRGPDNLKAVFESTLSSAGRMLALIDSWRSPTYHKRIWTQFEQFTATELNIPVTMILPPQEVESLQAEIDSGQQGFETVASALYEIDAESATATVKEDEVAVKTIIRQGVGFARLNEKVRGLMQDCVAKEFRALLRSRVISHRNIPTAKVLAVTHFTAEHDEHFTADHDEHPPSV